MVRENLKIQRNGEPVAECFRVRGIRFLSVCVTRAKPNFCSIFGLNTVVYCIISFFIGQPEVLVTQVDVGIIQAQDFFPSSFTEIFFTMARPRLLTTVRFSSSPPSNTMLKAMRVVPSIMTSFVPRFGNRTVKVWFPSIVLGLLVTTILWRIFFTPRAVHSERWGSSLFP